MNLKISLKMDLQQLLNTFVLVNFKNDTNNLYQLLFIGLILYSIKNYYFILREIRQFYEKYVQHKSSIELSMKLQSLSTSIKTYFVPSNKVLSVLYKLKNTKLNVTTYEEIHTSFEENDDDAYLYGNTELVPLLKEYSIDKDLFITIRIDSERVMASGRQHQRANDDNTVPCEYKVITIILSSYNRSVDYIQSFLTTWEKEFLDYKNRDNNRLTILTTGISLDDDGKNMVKFNKYNFSSNKSFSNLFFDGKDQIIDRINKFITNLDHYKRLGIPHSLGFLFHGVPGAGKTSAIKAIANYTNRSIISVNMNHISSIEDLVKLFNNQNIGFRANIPLNKRMYVFEEIDCYDYFLSRNLVTKKEVKEDNNITEILTDVLAANNQNKKYKPKDKDKTNEITIGQILEVLDGIIECEDRLCIFTTNHIEKIDKALLRPGRIDMIIEFKKLRRCDIQNLYKLWFNRDIPEKDLKNIKDYCITQADFGKLCFENMNNPNKLISVLSKL